MTILGETKRAREIGYKQGYHLYQWCACLDCGKPRWVKLVRSQPVDKRCKFCAAKRREMFKSGNAPNWKGGRRIDQQGYVRVWVAPDDFFAPMRDSTNYVKEHRLVVAKALGRCLHRWEIVHHKGIKYPKGSRENRSDNRYPENLQLVTDDRHKQISILEMQIKKLKKENKRLLQLIKDSDLRNCQQ